MVHNSLLPPNATATERAVEIDILALRDIPVPTATVWNTKTCPAELLPWFAWALSVDEWLEDWPETFKRDILASSVEVHRHKGTLASVRDAIAAFGFGNATVVEGSDAETYNGSLTYDGNETYGTPSHWAEYRVFLNRPITNNQALFLRRILAKIAPARCVLAGLIFTETAFSYDGALNYDGAQNYGVA